MTGSWATQLGDIKIHASCGGNALCSRKQGMADPWQLPLLDFSVAADAREEPHVRFTGATAECARSQGWQAPGTTGWLEDFEGCGDERSLVLRLSRGADKHFQLQQVHCSSTAQDSEETGLRFLNDFLRALTDEQFKRATGVAVSPRFSKHLRNI